MDEARPPVPEIRRILAFEPARVLHNPAAILGAAFGAALFAWAAVQLGQSAAELDKTGELGKGFIGWIADKSVAEMFTRHSATVASFFLLALFIAPFIAMLMSADQVASDIGRKHLRFLLPRVTRRGLYVARAIGAWVSWIAFVGPVAVAASLGLTFIARGAITSEDVVFALRVAGTLVLYGLPFVAIMSFTNTFTGNAALAFLIGMAFWIVVALISGIGGWIDENLKLAGYLFPTSAKYLLAVDDGRSFALGAGIALAHAAAFFFLGLFVFERRDV